MTREEAKEVFLNRGFIDGIYNGDKWREACIVISEWLEQEPTTKNNLGVDCISRKAALDITWHDPSYSDPLNVLTEVRDKIRELPSVTPQEPCEDWYDVPSYEMTLEQARQAVKDLRKKLMEYLEQEPRKGHWIYDYTSADGHRTYHCSECGCYLQPKHSEPLNSFKWCSLCGADMRGEVKE